MTFTEPVLLAIGAGLIAIVVVGLRSHARRRWLLAEFLGGHRATRRLAGSDLHRPPVERMLLLLVAAAALSIASAGPTWRLRPDESPPPRGSVMLAVDVSASMQGTDVAPTRFARAVELARELADVLEHDRVGLCLFAGGVYVLAPPSQDHRPLEFLLDGLTPNIVSLVDPGTRLSQVIGEAGALMAADGEDTGPRSIIIIGDGEVGEAEPAVLEAARSAAARGTTIHTIGVGTDDGTRMVLPADRRAGGLIVDRNGLPVVSHLQEQLLRGLAEAGGGAYARADDPEQMSHLRETFVQPPPTQRPADRVDPRFWLVIVALACLSLESLLGMRYVKWSGARRRPMPVQA